MDPRARPATYRQLRGSGSHREHPIFNALVAVGFAALGYLGFTTAANGPSFGPATILSAPVIAASLSYSGDDLIITGSVGHMFDTGTFSGPNRAEKRNRALAMPDALAFVRGFEEIRVRLASLRSGGALDPTEGPQSRVVDAEIIEAGHLEDEPKISVAAIGPLADSAALDAIDTLAAPSSMAPVPFSLSERVAYARADAPLTTFDGVLDAKGKKVSEKELWCLATAIYFESRGEKYRGQVAVAQVVLNRLKHPIYPKTICGVVFQNQNRRNACQFSFACDGIPERVNDRKSWAQAEEIAKGAVAGTLYLTEVGHATHYHATYVYPHWAPRMKKVTKIGLHVFYQFKRGWRFG